jgi:hypothetical protein
MDILRLVKEVLEQQNPQEKQYILEQLCDVFEYHHNVNKMDVLEGVRILLAAALQEENKDARETFFRTIDLAVAHHDLKTRIDWDRLVGMLPSLGKWELVSVLDILGFSGEVRYLPVLEDYAHHSDPEIREGADDAIENITSWAIATPNIKKAG